MTIAENRQELHDAILLHGPDRFDLSSLWRFGGKVDEALSGTEAQALAASTKGWTACVYGHWYLLHPDKAGYLALELDEDVPTERNWGMIRVDGWNMGVHYQSLIKDDHPHKWARWATVVEYLQRLIKRDGGAA